MIVAVHDTKFDSLEARVLALEEALGVALEAIRALQEQKVRSLEAQHDAFTERWRKRPQEAT